MKIEGRESVAKSECDAPAASAASTLWLLLIVAVGLGLRLRGAATWHLGYDEGWDIFAAGLQPFSDSLIELQRLSHPPLFYLALRPFTALGESLVWPRLTAVIPGCASIVLLHMCARRLGLVRPIAWLGALLLALSYSHIQISAEARPYSLATMLLLAAFAGFLEVVADPRGARPEVVRRCLGLAALAAWTEYATLVAIAAMAFSVAAFSLGSQAYRAEVAQLARRQCFALASFVVALVALGLYLGWSHSLGGHTYLMAFAPDGSESLANFALRGTAAILSYFTPFTFRVDTVLVITLLLAVAVVVALGMRFLPRRSSHHDRGKAAAVLMPVLLLALIFLLSLAGLYPFGGYMRHQFILFPFALLLLLTALDVVFRALPGPGARSALCSVIGAATLAAAITAQSKPPNEEFPRDALWRDEVFATRQLVASGDWLYMPSLSLYGFAGSLRGWSWRVIGSCGPMCSLLLAEHDDQQIHVVHDRARFVLPSPLDASLVESLADLMRQRRAKVLWVLDMQREPPRSPQTTAAPGVLARNGLSFEQAASFRDGALLRFTIR